MSSSPRTGLLEWSNAVRLSMANDPGRQLFQDQVNTHGFLFLQDYMDNILYKTKSDPLIELVKTPGRKKVNSKKAKPMSKLNNLVSLSFEINKENPYMISTSNDMPLTDRDVDHATDTSSLETGFCPIQSTADDGAVQLTTSSRVLVPLTTLVTVDQDSYTEHETDAAPGHSEPNELSIIAEGDENADHSHIPIDSVQQYSNLASENHLSIPSSSHNAIYSTTLDSLVSAYHGASQIPPSQRSASSLTTHQTDVNPPSPHNEHPLPDSTLIQDGLTRECFPKTAITPTPTLAHVMDVNGENLGPMEASPADSKSTISLFPALPAPVPLRKSIRTARDPSVGMTTPGVTLGGRTSWLKKAREVKAMEESAKNLISTSTDHSVLPTSLHNALKRKSGDALTISESTGSEGEERQPKSAKIVEGSVASSKPKVFELPQTKEMSESAALPSSPQHPQEGMLDRLKRTVEGLGARVGKSMGKPPGNGAAVSALAEARAAAEARVTERNNKEDNSLKTSAVPFSTTVVGATTASPGAVVADDDSSNTVPQDTGRRLSLSDLFPPNDGKARIKSKMLGHPPGYAQGSKGEAEINHESTTTTPPDSPSVTHKSGLPSTSLFHKPPPVFIPPVPIVEKVPTAHSLSPLYIPPPTQPILGSAKPDSFLDDDVTTWLPTTRNTEPSQGPDSQFRELNANVLDEDDSWPIDEKIALGVQWTFGAGIDREDSMTWSSIPSQSHGTNTGRLDKYETPAQPGGTDDEERNALPVNVGIDIDEEEYQGDGPIRAVVNKREEARMSGTHTADHAELKFKTESQMSMTSSMSSQSQFGLLGQASKILSNALGTSKKGKPGVEKVLQMAAMAAKKQQEESDKKTARLKEMENRRQLALQRKAEEEKVRSQERDRKLKEDGERRKREREDTTEKRSLKPAPGSKKDDDNMKKRKIAAETDKKPELKKPALKSALKPPTKQPIALSSSATYNASLQTTMNLAPNPADAKSSKPITSQKGKVTAPNIPVLEDDLSQPSQLVQIQMAARAKAQLQAAKQIVEPSIQSESIELPDINSEYSDSEDEERPRTFDPPDWAQSPELRQALQVQSTINPDDIFGAIRPLKMEELFKTRTSRFRARTSSANWTGSDKLTTEEEQEYVRRMGFR